MKIEVNILFLLSLLNVVNFFFFSILDIELFWFYVILLSVGDVFY